MKNLSILLIAIAVSMTSCKNEKKVEKTLEKDVLETAATMPKKIKMTLNAKSGSDVSGHWNPTAQPHGKWGAETGYHKGDIGNFTADENGHGTITFATNEWCIGCGDETKDILGKGVIVHAGADDLTSQPSGAAGARVSCAGIIQ